MKANIIQVKSFESARKIIKLNKVLRAHREFVFANQLLRSGTSIGANVEEAIGGQSKKDFLSKISIAYKEARETSYWLRLLKAEEVVKNYNVKVILDDCDEIIRIITKIQKTTKERISNY